MDDNKFRKAPEEVIELLSDVRALWHPDLDDARIDVRFCMELRRSKGKTIMGKAAKVPEQWQYYVPFDFIIDLCKYSWQTLTHEQRMALLDHELSHCRIDDGGACTIVGHDTEEFFSILQRHGLWAPGEEKAIEALKPHFRFMDELDRGYDSASREESTSTGEKGTTEYSINGKPVAPDELGEAIQQMLNGNGIGHEMVEEENEDA